MSDEKFKHLQHWAQTHLAEHGYSATLTVTSEVDDIIYGTHEILMSMTTFLDLHHWMDEQPPRRIPTPERTE